MSISNDLLQILACPRCQGPVQLLHAAPGPAEKVEKKENGGEEAQGLACAACALVYPLRQGIPVMLREEAIARLEWENGKRQARGKRV